MERALLIPTLLGIIVLGFALPSTAQVNVVASRVTELSKNVMMPEQDPLAKAEETASDSSLPACQYDLVDKTFTCACDPAGIPPFQCPWGFSRLIPGNKDAYTSHTEGGQGSDGNKWQVTNRANHRFGFVSANCLTTAYSLVVGGGVDANAAGQIYGPRASDAFTAQVDGLHTIEMTVAYHISAHLDPGEFTSGYDGGEWGYHSADFIGRIFEVDGHSFVPLPEGTYYAKPLAYNPYPGAENWESYVCYPLPGGDADFSHEIVLGSLQNTIDPPAWNPPDWVGRAKWEVYLLAGHQYVFSLETLAHCESHNYYWGTSKPELTSWLNFSSIWDKLKISW